MDIRSELAVLGVLGVVGVGVARGLCCDTGLRMFGGGLEVYCLGGIGVRFWSNGFIGGDFSGGLLTEVGGNSETGMGVVGNVGKFIGDEKAGLGGRQMSGGFLSGNSGLTFSILLSGAGTNIFSLSC